MSDDKKRDRALQRRVRERMAKTGESYQAAWQQLADQKAPEDPKQLFARSSTGLFPLDDVLGGGLVSGSVVLLAGPVGSGRTSLTLQMLKGLGNRCLYVTSEDTPEQAAANAQRVKAVSDQISQLAERDVAKILAYAQEIQAKTIAIDTIQKIFCADIGRGSTQQIVECVNRLVDYAKTNDTAIWLVGHVTSDGTVARPQTIEHSVDVVLTIECGAYFEGRARIVSCAGKNRFGPSNRAGCFELTAEGFVLVDGEKVPGEPLMMWTNQQMFDGTIRVLDEKQPSAREAPRNVSRVLFPFSSAVKVLPGQSAQVTARPQILSFWPDRLLIKNADRWAIQRLTIGTGKSPWASLIEDGPHRERASMFAFDTWHPLIKREVSLGEPIGLAVTYIGPNDQGENFEAALFGWEECPPDRPSDRNDSAADQSNRVSEHAESKSVRANEMAILPITIVSSALFVDRFTIVDAKNWIVHDVRTHGKSIFLHNGDVPGEMFSGSVPVILKPLAVNDSVEIAATYVGKNASACLMVELSGPTKPTSTQRAASYFLPVSTDIPISPTQSVQIKGQSGKDFLPDRVVIAEPDAWIINDIKIGGRCLTAQSGDVPGQTFSTQAVGCDVTFIQLPAGCTFEIVTTRAEHFKESTGFYGGVQGRLVQEL